MDKEKLKEVLPKLVEALTSDETRAKLEEAKGDLGKVLGVVFEAQGAVLMAAGVDPMEGLTALGKLEKGEFDDPELQELGAKLKAQVEALKKG